jgi:predicted metalloprotease with PDZ domain
MGIMDRHDFTVKGIPFSAILVGETDVDPEALIRSLTKVSEAGIGIMGHAPFKRYYYIIHMAEGNFGGGLEHRSSTVLNVSGNVGKQPHPWAWLSAHEFFHLYNVKRIRPDVLGPFDYQNKVRTPSLWFAEGVTEYYAQVILRKSGITTPEDFLGWMSGEIANLQRNPARLKISAEEASRRGWEGGSFGFGGLSYYQKGSLLGLYFDIRIRAATANRKSLDDVMRRLDEEYGKKNVGYPEDGILKALTAVGGVDFSPEYDRLVRRTEEIPWEETLRAAGLRFTSLNERQAATGFSTTRGEADQVLIQKVDEENPAVGGLKAGDELASLNGMRVRFDAWQRAAERFRPGQRLLLGIRRDNRPFELIVTVGSRSIPPDRVVPIAEVDEAARRIRDGLLRRNTQAADIVPPLPARVGAAP